jgi:outer membrane receptor protein involved in Fe transport
LGWLPIKTRERLPFKDWRFTTNFAYMEAKYKNDPRNSGLRLAWVPRKITNMELAYTPQIGLGGRVTFRYEDDMLYSDSRSGPWRAPSKAYLDTQLSYKINEKYKILFDAKNIIGKSYEGYAYGKDSYGDYLVNWLNPRAFYLTFVMNWDAKE